MRALHAIILDFDGVIADSERLHLKAYQDILAEEGWALRAEEYFDRYLGYDDEGVFRMLARDRGWDVSTDAVATLIERKGARYEQLAAAGDMLFAGASSFIRQAAAAVPIAIASGALSHEIEDVLARTGLKPCFGAIVGADHTERSKPSPDPYLEAFARLQIATSRVFDRHRTVAIEDSRWGLEAARAAGLRCVAVTNTYTATELAGHAEMVVSGLSELSLEALDELCET
jgi:beta-phosphoglucomutase